MTTTNIKRLKIYFLSLLFCIPLLVNAQNKFKTGVPKTGTRTASFNPEVVEYKDKTITEGRIWMNVNGESTVYNVRKTSNEQYWFEKSGIIGAKVQNLNVPIKEDNAQVLAFIRNLKPGMFGVKGSLTFAIDKKRMEGDKAVFMLNQTIKGYPIFNATAVCGLENNVVNYFIGKIEPISYINDSNLISAELAIEKALEITKTKRIAFSEVSSLFNYETELKIGVFKQVDKSYVLAYSYTFHPNNLNHIHVLVNAKTGEILKWVDETCEIDGPKTLTSQDLNNVNKTVGTYEKSGVTYLIDASKSMFNGSAASIPNEPEGVIWTLNANNTYLENLTQCNSSDGSIVRKDAISAQNNASLCYDYFKNTLNRNGIDGNGGTIISVVNCSDNNGQTMDNAFWNGSIMAYGNGKSVFKPLAGSLDVGGHEMTHGVVQQTANLIYENQSGALNESFADVFGCMIDRANWQLGESIVKTGFGNTALRDLSDPHNNKTSLGQNGYQPRHMSEFYSGSDDNGGVHINSGIANWAYYKFATSVSKEKAEKVYYRALSLYLNSSSEFLDCRYAVVKAAEDLHGAGSTEVLAAKKAFDDVGIYDPNGNTGGGSGSGTDEGVFTLPTNLGTQQLLVTNDDPSASSQLAIYNYTTRQVTGIGFKEPKSMPSVIDNGEFAVYVDNNAGALNSILLSSPYTNTILENSVVWDRAAISKNGKLIAGITSIKDTSINVYNFDLKKWKKFKLYNPTFTQGVDAGGVKYADVIEFNHSGEYIMYDQLSEIVVNGSVKEFWDIGVIKVWDLTTNTWGDGKVKKLFNQLDDNESIGNPSYSRNSPHIIVFDLIKESLNTYGAIGMNTSSGTLGFISSYDNPGRPTYGVTDQISFFQDINGSSNSIYYRLLATDKITAQNATTNVEVISGGKWGYEFAKGTRRLLNDENSILTFSFPALSTPVNCTIVGTTINCTVANGTIKSTLIPTFTNSPVSSVKVNNVLQTSGVNSINFDNLVTYSVKSQNGDIKNYTVNVVVGTIGVKQTNEISLPLQILPNPNKGTFEVGIKNGTLTIYDFTGRKITEVLVINGKVKTNLEKGNYIVKMQSNGKLYQSIVAID